MIGTPDGAAGGGSAAFFASHPNTVSSGDHTLADLQLAQVIEEWVNLPDTVRCGILAMVSATSRKFNA